MAVAPEPAPLAPPAAPSGEKEQSAPEAGQQETLKLSSCSWTTSKSTSSSKSFLEDRSPVRGMQDIIGRMRVTEDPSSNAGIPLSVGANSRLKHSA